MHAELFMNGERKMQHACPVLPRYNQTTDMKITAPAQSDHGHEDHGDGAASPTPRVAEFGSGPATTSPSAPAKPATGSIAKPTAAPKKRFYSTISIDPVAGAGQFADVMQEVVQHFSSQHGVKVTISVEIEAIHPVGFDSKIQGTVRENAQTLGFKQAEFEND